VVVGGVTASGKSTVGKALAQHLGVEYGDADDFHPPGNIAKMRAGKPLTDADRAPWLTAIAEWLAKRTDVGAVASCSVLGRRHRRRLLADAPGAVFLLLHADATALRERMSRRTGHFMPESLLQSQLDAFEPLDPDEPGLTIDASQSVQAIVTEFAPWLHSREEGAGRTQA